MICSCLNRYISGFFYSLVRSRTIANTFHVAPGLFVFRSSKACPFGFRYTVLCHFYRRIPHRLVLSLVGTRCSLFFSWRVPQLLLFFQRVVIMRFCFITFAMRKVSFSSVLAVPLFRSIGSNPFLTRRCSGLTHIAASTAELIR